MEQHTAVQTSLLYANGLLKQSKPRQSSPSDNATVVSNTSWSKLLVFR